MLDCSAAWFERVAAPATVRTIYSLKTDKLHNDSFLECADSSALFKAATSRRTPNARLFRRMV